MKKGLILGTILIFLGIGLYAYYDLCIKTENQAKELLTEAKLIFERGSKEAINDSINIFSKVVAKYPKTKAAIEAYFYIGQSYEELGLERLAYLKYIYILKTNPKLEEKNQDLSHKTLANLAKLKINKNQTAEGINQLFALLNNSNNQDLRSRVYCELGHTYLKKKDYKEAKEMFNLALSEKATNEEAILGKARTLKRMGFSNKAYDLYDYFLKYYGNFSHFSKDIKGSYPNQLYETAYNSVKSKQYYQAINSFKRFLRTFNYQYKTENCYYWLGECYYALGKYDTALSYFEKVFHNNYKHKDEDAMIKKGFCYFKLTKYALAIQEFKKYLKKYPKGKHAELAKKWNQMSEDEIINQVLDRKIPEFNEELEKKEDLYKFKNNFNDPYKYEKYKQWKGETKATDKSSTIIHTNNEKSSSQIEYENVAEL